MEIFLFLFVLFLWIYLSQPKKEPPKKDPWEEMGKAIGTALRTLNAPADGNPSRSSGNQESFPWFIPLAIVTGLAVYLFR